MSKDQYTEINVHLFENASENTKQKFGKISNDRQMLEVKLENISGYGGHHGRPQKFFQGGQSRHFACHFQVAYDAM